jgi:hypothetical protein
MCAHLVRDHLPHRTFADGFDGTKHVIEHAMSLLTKSCPIGRVKRGSSGRHFRVEMSG